MGAYPEATGMIVVVANMHPALAVITDSAPATIAAHMTDVILVTFMDSSVVHAHLIVRSLQLRCQRKCYELNLRFV